MKQALVLLAVLFTLSMANAAAPVVDAAKPSRKQTCCEIAIAAGKECTHKCCVAAHRTGKSCEKCNPKKEDLVAMKAAEKAKAASRKK